MLNTLLTINFNQSVIMNPMETIKDTQAVINALRKKYKLSPKTAAGVAYAIQEAPESR